MRANQSSFFYFTEQTRDVNHLPAEISHLLTLSILTLHCHLHPLQAANCCRTSRLVVDEDDLMWFKN